MLLRSCLFTGAETLGRRTRLVGAPRRPSDDDLDYYFSQDRIAESPAGERVHFWPWFADVSSRTANATWFVESWSTRPPAAETGPGGATWQLVAEGTVETAELVIQLVAPDEMGTSDRQLGVTGVISGVRVHLVDDREARRREDAWFHRQIELAGDAWEYPAENPAYDINPVLIHVWPA